MSTLWLAIELPHLALDLLSRGKEGVRDLPMAISDADARRPKILDCNPAASRLGIRAGMPLNAARGLAGALQLTDRSPHAEQQALERLAAWCYQYSSAVSILPGRHALLLESGGSERLLGDSAALAQRLTGELLNLGYHARAGTGPTPEGALLAARRGLNLPTLKALQETLGGLPLDALLVESAQYAALEKMGFRRVRDVMRLPRKALARRLGTAMVEYLDRLSGVRPDPQRHWIPPERFSSLMDLPAEVNNSQGLLFPLRRLVGELCGVLRAADRGIQELNIHLQLRRGEERLQLRLQQPSRDEQHFMDLLRERLERFRLPQPACSLSLDTDEFLSFDAAPQGLFVDPDNPASNPVEPLLERLRARLGESAVAGLNGVEDHRPEYSWARRRLEEPARCQSLPHRPVWLLPRPERCRIEDYRVLAGPERIESGWWDGHDCRRDYFVVRDCHGSTLWAYREYKPEPGWYLQGLFG